MAISLGFVFGLAVFALMYQTYLSVLIFRVLCDVTVRFVICTVGKGRIKMQPKLCGGSSTVSGLCTLWRGCS